MTLKFFLTSMFLATPFIHAQLDIVPKKSHEIREKRAIFESFTNYFWLKPSLDEAGLGLENLNVNYYRHRTSAKPVLTRRRKRAAEPFGNPLGFFASMFEAASPPNIPYVVLPSVLERRPIGFTADGAIPSYSGVDPAAVSYNARGLGSVNEASLLRGSGRSQISRGRGGVGESYIGSGGQDLQRESSF